MTPLFALDRLNSWVRSREPAWCPIRSALKPVIYWVKTQAILDASKREHIGMLRVMVKRPCRVCNATGIWLPDYWTPDDGDYSNRDDGYVCRKCSGTGIVHLKFIETTIGPLRWHTPAYKWYSSSLDVYVPFPSFYHNGEEHYEISQGWEPDKPGRPMNRQNLWRDVNIILEAYPHEFCFSLDFHQHTQTEKQWNCPDIEKAKGWLGKLFEDPRS